MENIRKVISCFKELGFKPKIDEFEDRLIAQKVVYLLELKGVKTGFPYNLYVRGPYSPELTKELYDNKNEVEQLKTDVVLTNNETRAVHELRDQIGLKPGVLEAAAAYAFFVSREHLSNLDALARLKAFKPFLSETQVAIGVSAIKEFIFRPTERELVEMKKEFEAWEKAPLN